mgnify:CR=1 FL=1
MKGGFDVGGFDVGGFDFGGFDLRKRGVDRLASYLDPKKASTDRRVGSTEYSQH